MAYPVRPRQSWGDSNNECRGVSRGRGSRSRAGQGEGPNNLVSNKGAAGIDGMKDEELRGYMNENWPGIKQSILERSYKPAPVRRVEIPKPNGAYASLASPRQLTGLSNKA